MPSLAALQQRSALSDAELKKVVLRLLTSLDYSIEENVMDLESAKRHSLISSPQSSKKIKLRSGVHGSEKKSTPPKYAKCLWCNEDLTNLTNKVPLSVCVCPKACASIKDHWNKREGYCHKTCGEKLRKFTDSCKHSLEEMNQDFRQSFEATLYGRSSGNQVETLDVKLNGEIIELNVIAGDSVHPYTVTKTGCHAHWSQDRRWTALREMVRDQNMHDQIVTVRAIMSLRFGTNPPYHRKMATAADLEAFDRIFEKAKISIQDRANRMWQYLCGVDLSAVDEGDEKEFLASYMAWFLVDHCARCWHPKDAAVVHWCYYYCWTTSWGPGLMLNDIYDQTSVIQPLSRKAPLPKSGGEHGAARHNARRFELMEKVRRQNTMLLIILAHSVLGMQLLQRLRAHPLYCDAPVAPMSLGFLLCEMRKRVNTGSTRFRQQWPIARRAALEQQIAKQHPHIKIVVVQMRHRGQTWDDALK